MGDATTTTGTALPAAATEQLLFTEDSTTGVRARARTTISEQAAYALSGGGDLHRDAHDVAVTNLLHCTSRSVIAFALHHLRPLLPDLSDEQWDRIDAAVTALGLRDSADFTGANGTEADDVQLRPGSPRRPGRLGRSTRNGARRERTSLEEQRGPDQLSGPPAVQPAASSDGVCPISWSRGAAGWR
ncbi:hypothetical protein [Streptomyces sp. Ac-502]|uniref:hypothetical protein n=1 Tax=Streptomyces sp. Ac-502 TaxID=3342801 RepID=UPI003862CB47